MFVRTRQFGNRPFLADPVALVLSPQNRDPLDVPSATQALVAKLNESGRGWFVESVHADGGDAIGVDFRMSNPADPTERLAAFCDLDDLIRSAGMVPHLLDMLKEWVPLPVRRQFEAEADAVGGIGSASPGAEEFYRRRFETVVELVRPALPRFWQDNDRELRAKADQESFRLLHDGLPWQEFRLVHAAITNKGLCNYYASGPIAPEVKEALERLVAGGMLDSYSLNSHQPTPSRPVHEDIKMTSRLTKVPFLSW